MKNLRKCNFEFLRVIAMLMVTTLHAIGHGGFLSNMNSERSDMYYLRQLKLYVM